MQKKLFFPGVGGICAYGEKGAKILKIFEKKKCI